MKILSTTFFIVLVGLICLTQMTLSKRCLEYVSPLHRYKTRYVDCSTVSSREDKRQIGPGDPSTPTPAPQPGKEPPPPAPGKEPPAPASPSSEPAPPPPNDKFTVNFDCPIADKTLCNKVDNVFLTAGNIITEVLNLNTPITVNAKFYDFCATEGECGANGKLVLGAAGPARMLPYQDPKEPKPRFYPQALYKQLNIPDHLEYGPVDIDAIFNSNVEYWFVGDPEPIPITQVDILYVVLHELVHGLGFASSWNDYASIQALTPLFANEETNNQGQFVELIFDKNLIFLPSGQPLTTFTDQLNEFQFTADMSDTQIIQSFMASPQFTIAKSLYAKAETPRTMGLLLNPEIPLNTQLTPEQIAKDVVTLETSFNPFSQGSSISHVDEITYLNSSDFLMMAAYPKRTLGDMMFNAGSTNTTGPIGPQLRLILEMMGYELKNSEPDNSSTSSSVPNSSDVPNSSNSASGHNPEINYKTAFIVSSILGAIFASMLLSLCSLLIIKKYSRKQKNTDTTLISGNNSIGSSRSIQMPKETMNPNRGRDVVNDSMTNYDYYTHGQGINNSPSNINNYQEVYNIANHNDNNSTENNDPVDNGQANNDQANHDQIKTHIVDIRQQEMSHQYNNPNFI